MKIYEHAQTSSASFNGFVSIDSDGSGVMITTRTHGKPTTTGVLLTAAQARDMAQSVLDAVPAPAPVIKGRAKK